MLPYVPRVKAYRAQNTGSRPFRASCHVEENSKAVYAAGDPESIVQPLRLSAIGKPALYGDFEYEDGCFV
jgi:hypothetical protein